LPVAGVAGFLRDIVKPTIALVQVVILIQSRSVMKTKASTGEERGDLLAPMRLAVERASSEAQNAGRRYMAVDPDDRVRSKTKTAETTITYPRAG